MPAIYGLFNCSGSSVDAVPNIASAMERRLVHRAPDGFTQWRRDAAWLGHGALNLAPVDGTSQPLMLEDGRVMVVDGFIANDEEVRLRLGLQAHIHLNDAQLFGLAIQHWQDRFHEYVHGEFALALWDPVSRHLDLWRDHLGARPLCYVQTKDWFGFASEAAPLLQLPDAPRRENSLAFITIWCDEANYQDLSTTSFEGIFQLPPAHHLRLSGGQSPAPQRYWQSPPLPRLNLADENEYVDAFREVFTTAVQRATRDSKRTGLMLSGGIDSGAILAAFRNFRFGAQAPNLLCVSAVAGPEVVDRDLLAESDNVRGMTSGEPDKLWFDAPAPKFGSLVTEDDVISLAMTRLNPSDIYLQVSAHACMLARERGCRLMLNGIDGDNVMVSGSYPMADLLREGDWRAAWVEAGQVENNTYLKHMSRSQVMIHSLYNAFAPSSLRAWRGQRRAQRLMRGLREHSVLNPSFLDHAGVAERIEASVLRKHSRDPQHCRDHRAYWLGFSMQGANQLAARNGMDIRFPWCDRRVVDFFDRVPPSYRSRHGWTKYLVRKACESALGGSAVWHTGKKHLGTLLNRQVVRVAGPRLASVLRAQREALTPYFRRDAIDRTIARLDRGSEVQDHEVDILLTTACMAGWLSNVRQSLERE